MREVEVDAYCLCNGQGNGLECSYNETLGDNVCKCQDGACGIDCGTCCPAYNQYPWKPGNKGPLVADPDAACQRMSRAALYYWLSVLMKLRVLKLKIIRNELFE